MKSILRKFNFSIFFRKRTIILLVLFHLFILVVFGSKLFANGLLPKNFALLLTDSEADIYLPIKDPHSGLISPIDLRQDRDRTKYYDLRQYPGAPPIIPHQEQKLNNQGIDCLTCHKMGGFVTSLKAYAPITPHPHYSACDQCHIRPQEEVKDFVESKWLSSKPPVIKQATLPGAPVSIPHSLQMRTNCLACHSGPAAVAPIRTPHPQRILCLQCHVEKNPAFPPQ